VVQGLESFAQEFDFIFVVGANRGVSPRGGSHQDPEQWTREKSMLHVAVTRARKAVWISGTGELSEFLHQG